MAIYPQPNTWQCGPFALKHALLMLGILADEKEITTLSRTRRAWGTTDEQLQRAARKFDCDLQMVRRLDPERARRDMVPYLRKGIPVLLCVEEWQHWVTVVRVEKGRYIILDSEDPAVLLIYTWRQLRARWVHREEDDYDHEAVHTLYDFHPVVPRFRVRTRPNLSLARVRHLRRPENRIISVRWNDYVADLSALAKIRTPLHEKVLSLGEFLRRHERMILDQVNYWHGALDARRAEKILRDLHFVADTFGMVIPAEEEKRSIAGITALLTLWAEGEVTGDSLYPERPPRPKA